MNFDRQPMQKSPALEMLAVAERRKSARVRAETQIKADISSGRVLAIGITYDRPGEQTLAAVPQNLATTAWYSWNDDRIQVGQLEYRNVRAFEVGTVSARDEPASLREPVPIVPPPEALRPEAIEACFNQQLIDFADSGLQQRVAMYLEWIGSRYPACDLQQRGFSTKSFEKDETEFKKSKGLSRS